VTRRRTAVRRVCAGVLALLLVGVGLGHGAERVGTARAVLSVTLTVEDLARSVGFFTDVLGFERVDEVDAAGPAYETLWSLPGVRARIARLRLGREEIRLVGFTAPKGRPVPRDSRTDDAWFQHLAIVVRDMTAAHARLVAHGVRAVSAAPQVLPPSNLAAAGIAAFYFADPDGHPLELIAYPPGKGDPRWQEGTDRLFLGIDHTAIAVADTDASLAFYRDRFGLRVVGESLNVGIEQERLTGVPGARVRITGLRAPGGPPGIELLDYRAPRSGRRLPAAPAVNDLVHWHVTLAVAGDARPTLVRDPDGHALEIVGAD
jgi:catechol 2,3-dioxygenase-like lactoylglutathione lyase family enzyme